LAERPKPSLAAVLEDAQRLGFLGRAPIDTVLAHASGFVACLPAEAAWIVDLGSGGGVPGLVVADARPEAHVVLLDRSERRASWLRRAVARLELGSRVEVVEAPAEIAGRDRRLRGAADTVVARSFATPAVTAECAAPLLRVGGTLVVSEPPGDTAHRWARAGLADLGLVAVASPDSAYAVFRQARRCPDRYPRQRPG
jgi:16S rRNA (guanine527-N7)-methyltransferase